MLSQQKILTSVFILFSLHDVILHWLVVDLSHWLLQMGHTVLLQCQVLLLQVQPLFPDSWNPLHYFNISHNTQFMNLHLKKKRYTALLTLKRLWVGWHPPLFSISPWASSFFSSWLSKQNRLSSQSPTVLHSCSQLINLCDKRTNITSKWQQQL